MLLLAHRGARRHAAENTLRAFDLALQQGADGFEFDVRLTGDLQTIVCHDEKLNRLSIQRKTLHDLQASCDPQEIAPTLGNVLQRYVRTAFLDIELKVKGLEHAVDSALKSFPPERGYFVSSFLPGVLKDLYAVNPAIKLGTLSDTKGDLKRWESLPALYVVPQYKLLSRALVEEVHAARKLVFTWTVNEPKEMQRVAQLGVDGVISDDPDLLRKTLGGS